MTETRELSVEEVRRLPKEAQLVYFNGRLAYHRGQIRKFSAWDKARTQVPNLRASHESFHSITQLDPK